MSFGEVDTLGMLFEKLESLFDESQGYYESFLDTNNMYKAGKISDKAFFQKLGDYTVAYSALEFLAIKVIFELKKSQGSGGPGNTQSPGLMPGMGQPGGMNPPPRAGTAGNPVGGGPPGIVSAQESFGDVGTLPSPDPSLMPRQTAPPQQQTGNGCSSCGAQLRPNSKFCTKCGAKA
jgi:hypothetical protein